MNTTRISAGAGTTSITHGHTTYVADDAGIFTVPVEVATTLLNLRVAVIAPDSRARCSSHVQSRVRHLRRRQSRRRRECPASRGRTGAFRLIQQIGRYAADRLRRRAPCPVGGRVLCAGHAIPPAPQRSRVTSSLPVSSSRQVDGADSVPHPESAECSAVVGVGPKVYD